MKDAFLEASIRWMTGDFDQDDMYWTRFGGRYYSIEKILEDLYLRYPFLRDAPYSKTNTNTKDRVLSFRPDCLDYPVEVAITKWEVKQCGWLCG